MSEPITITLDGVPVTVPPGPVTLLDALRGPLGVRSVKDGCSPQGQCGCCTVLVDGQPRVACVTPLGRVAGRSVTTVDGLAPSVRDAWAGALCATGGTQCGFCTPGIVVRLAALPAPTAAATRQALLAHLCRCTGWQTIVEAAERVAAGDAPAGSGWSRHPEPARRRAAIEGGVAQHVGPEVALGRGGFADDTAPADALVAMRSADGSWVVAESVAEARAAVGKVQGRRSTAALSHPLDVPDGPWVRTLRTTWVEPAYLEPDASWCVPGGEPVSPLANGGAFGGKVDSPVAAAARRLADEHGRPVRVVLSREDVVRFGPKRPPVAAGVRADGTGFVRVVRAHGIAERFGVGFAVEEVEVSGPPVSSALRAAGWAEAAILRCSVAESGVDVVTAPNGAVAEASVVADGSVSVRVRCGAVLDPAVLRSYCIGAAHMALGWVRSEGIAVDAAGEPQDLTIRSFGILRAADMPRVDVELVDAEDDPVNGSDAVFAAVAAAAWRHAGYPQDWPTARR